MMEWAIRKKRRNGAKSRDSNLMSSSVVGDRNANWRLKSMKLKERWGSLGKLAVSVASNSVAPSHAHLHAIKVRLRQ
ncbi:hypothetical protein Tco_1367623 [Tanacetum coccineum]